MQLNNKLRIFGGIAIGVSLVIWLTCSYNEPVAGGSTETTNSKVSGFLYNPHGSPALNVSIKIVSVDYNPKPDGKRDSLQIDSTLTDGNGRFLFASLSTGYFNILGEGDSGYAYQDSLYIPPDENIQAPPDTLKAPGSIRGIVRLQPEDNPELVFIVVLGTPLWTMPDDPLGNFILLNMAEGAYRVRFLTTLDDYDPFDTVVTITAGKNTVLHDTIFLPFIGIPTPTGLSCVYDTLNQVVTLQWNPADTNLIKGYNLYRKHSDSDYVKLNMKDIEQPFFIDSLNGGPSFDGNYSYTVTAIDKNGNEGKKCSEEKVSVIGNCKGWSIKTPVNPVMELLSGVIDSVLYCFGGVDRDGASPQVLKYNAVNDLWSNCAPIPEPRLGASGSALNNKYYYFGGEAGNWMSSNYEYDPLQNVWNKKPNECLLGKEIAAGDIDNVLIVAGGVYGVGGINDSVSQYDPVTDVWTARTSMHKARTKLCVCSIKNTLYAIGGSDGNSVLSIVEEYDYNTDTWTLKTSMPTARSALACCVYNGKIFVFGGSNGEDVVSTVEMYDPELDEWFKKSPMPTAKMDLTAASVHDKIYVIGGFNGDSIVGVVEEYDPLLDP